jgi:hypothetical protein
LSLRQPKSRPPNALEQEPPAVRDRRRIQVITLPTRLQRKAMPENPQRLIARLRDRVETSSKEITDQMELARHGAHTLDGLLTRTAATLAAHTLLLTLPPEAI